MGRRGKQEGKQFMKDLKSSSIALILFSTILSLVSCTSDDQADVTNEKMIVELANKDTTLQHEYILISESPDVQDDFERALKNKDLRFVGIMGFALIVPGVPDHLWSFGNIDRVKVIWGTSDSYADSTELARQIWSESYATRYNKLLLLYIEENPSDFSADTLNLPD